MARTEPIIEVTDVTMRFNLAKEITDSIKEYLLKMISGKLHFNEFFALKNISFQIDRGDAVALIGKNGSGKSTMLKILAGVMYPTKGKVDVRGSVAPLIELGAGFDMELTARENVYLNGAILGYDRDFMSAHMEQIISFSELESFVDVPLKNFSSGMVARLGFAIATIIRADILIVDEVLAVGDFKFQEKCKAKIAELLSDGATLLFVSHSIEQVKELCTKAIWLDGGELKAYGDTETVCAQYMSHYGG